MDSYGLAFVVEWAIFKVEKHVTYSSKLQVMSTEDWKLRDFNF